MEIESESEALEAELGAAYDAAQSTEDEDQPSGEEDEAQEEPSANDDAEEEAGESDGNTDENTDSDDEDDDQASSDDEEDGSEAPPSAPRSWSATEREFFKSLPRDSQERISDIWQRREGDLTAQFNAKTTELGEKAKAYEAFDQVIAPHRNGAAANIEAEAQAIGQLAQINQFAVQNPAGYMKWFMQRTGLTLDQLEDEQSAPTPDPMIHTLQSELQTLKSKLAERDTVQQQERQTAIRKQIDTFKAATDDKGNLKHEFFDDVQAEMAAILKSNPGISIESAYSKACRMNDDVWQVMQERETAKNRNAKQLEEARAIKAAKANSKGGAVKTKAASKPGRGGKSEDEILAEVYDRHHG